MHSVPRVESADVPQHAALRWERLSRSNLPLWHDLLEVTATADDAQEHHTIEDLHDELDSPSLDRGEDTVLGLDPDGVARAFGLILLPPGDATLLRVTCWGGVHPQWRRRGLGTALLGWQLAQAHVRAQRRRHELSVQVPGFAYLGVDEHRDDLAAIAVAQGLSAQRWYWVMRRPLRPPLPSFELPVGLRLTGFSMDLDERLRLAHNEAFAEHWSFQPWAPQSWQQWSTGHRNFRGDWSFAVLDGDQVAAYALCAGYEQDWAMQGWTEGWTSKLGVLPPWRGRGLAKVLLAASLQAFSASGMDYAGLDVDSENRSGAVALYEGLGYQVRRRSALWGLAI